MTFCFNLVTITFPSAILENRPKLGYQGVGLRTNENNIASLYTSCEFSYRDLYGSKDLSTQMETQMLNLAHLHLQLIFAAVARGCNNVSFPLFSGLKGARCTG